MKLHDHVSSHHSFMYLWILGALLVLGGMAYAYIGTHPNGVLDGEHEGDVRTTVAAFGAQLNTVSLLAPTARDDLARVYGPYVAPELLAAWAANPESAPGRMASSPWPDHIEVDAVTKKGDGSYAVVGRVVYTTSANEAIGVPVALTVASGAHGFVITAYREGADEPAPSPVEPTTVTVAIGEPAHAHGVSVTPTKLLEDSRCPSDVVCIQAGTVRVEAMLVDGMGTSTMPFILGSTEPVTSEVASIYLIAVEPYPIASDPTEDASYRFTFRIERR